MCYYVCIDVLCRALLYVGMCLCVMVYVVVYCRMFACVVVRCCVLLRAAVCRCCVIACCVLCVLCIDVLCRMLPYVFHFLLCGMSLFVLPCVVMHFEYVVVCWCVCIVE